MTKKKVSGFTLLELLIVIAIIAILSVALVLVLNPAETLRKARDGQRLSDMSVLKTAIGFYMTNVSTPTLGASASNTTCQATAGTWQSGDKIFYSLNSVTTDITDTTLDGGTTFPYDIQPASMSAGSAPDGSGWVPVNFSAITGGSPISNVPIDPLNIIANGASVNNSDFVYRYACSESPLAYEIDAVLESSAYTTGTDNKLTSDGGNSTLYYETGTNLGIMGVGGANVGDY